MNKINKWKKSISTDQYSFRNEYQATIKKKKKNCSPRNPETSTHIRYFSIPHNLITGKGDEGTAKCHQPTTDFRSRPGYHYPIGREATEEQLGCIIVERGEANNSLCMIERDDCWTDSHLLTEHEPLFDYVMILVRGTKMKARTPFRHFEPVPRSNVCACVCVCDR